MSTYDHTDDDTTQFQLLEGETDGRLFLRVFDGTTHVLVEIDRDELTDLRHAVAGDPQPFRR